MPSARDFFRTLFAREGRRRERREPRVRRKLRSLPMLVAVSMIALVMFGVGLWWRSGIFALMQERPNSSLQSMSVLLLPEPGKNKAELGWRDIGQAPGSRSAEDSHVEFALGPDDTVTVRNIARIKRLWLSFKGGGESWQLFGRNLGRIEPAFETFAERIPIPRGKTSRLFVTGGSATFRNVTSTSFDLEVESAGKPKRTFQYRASNGSDGLEAVGGAAWDAACAKPNFLSRLRRAAADLGDLVYRTAYASVGRTWLPGTEIDIAVLGGEHDCAEDGRKQIGNIGTLRWRELKIVRRGGYFMIAPYDPADRHKLPVAMGVIEPPEPVANRQSFSKVAWRVDSRGPWGEIDSIILGRTDYRVVLCRAGAANDPVCGAYAVPARGVRVVLAPRSKVPLINAANCQQPEQRDVCPSPLDLGAAAKPCDDAGAKCWQWSNPYNSLLQQAASSAVSRLTTWERLLRIGISSLALIVVIALALRGSNRLMRRRETQVAQQAAAPSGAPIGFVLLSALLTLAPEISNALGRPLDARWAFTIMLTNWWLAGIVLLAGVSWFALSLLWVAVMVLCAVGSTALAAMAVDGDTTAWAQYFVRQKYLFLDIVPPVILMVASIPPRKMRPVLQELVVGVRPRYRFVLWLPSVLLVCVFGLWLVMGSQTGLGAFQPAEPGKFAAVLLAAAALLRLDPDIQRAAVGGNVAARLTSFLTLGGFFFVLVAVPTLRNDWSPVLIIMLLMGGLLAAFVLPLCWRTIASVWRRRVARHHVPLAFRPKPKRRLFGPVTVAFAIPIVLFVGLAAALPVSKLAATWMLNLSEWSSDSLKQLRELELHSLAGRRRVVAERFIAWTDLMFSMPPRASCAFDTESEGTRTPNADAAMATPRACYRDLEWQVIRARKVVAQAECGIKGPLGVTDGSTLERIVTALTPALGSVPAFLTGRMFCGAPAGEPAVPTSELDVIEPIRIPVVESDFAGAYLIGRFGVGAAMLMYAGQVLLLAIFIFAFIRVGSTHSGNRMDAGLRRFIAVVVAGAGLLFLLQWMFAWSNSLGLLPVMGQPMTLLSYAVSHNLFMALPCLMVLVVGLRLVSYDQATMVPRGVPRRRRWALFN